MLRAVFALSVLSLLVPALHVGGCAVNEGAGQPGPADETRWYVYRDADSKDNHGAWSNWMPEEAGKMIKLSLVDKADPHSGATCARVDVSLQPPDWCGIAVSCQPDYWGEKPSTAAYDLRKAKRLVFYAKGAKGGETIQVKVAIAGDKPFGDSAKSPAETEWISLSKGWKKYELDLKGYDLKRVVTPFVFVVNKDNNPRGQMTFFLDDIYMVMSD